MYINSRTFTSNSGRHVPKFVQKCTKYEIVFQMLTMPGLDQISGYFFFKNIFFQWRFQSDFRDLEKFLTTEFLYCPISLEMCWNESQPTFKKNIFLKYFLSNQISWTKILNSGFHYQESLLPCMSKCSKVIFTPC